MKIQKRRSLRWLVAAALGGAILAGTVAYAQRRDCWECKPCGCSPDGVNILCCGSYGCG